MSLDVYLVGPEREVKCECAECGHEHTRKERETFWCSNITHNLGAMAEAAGIYDACWRPEEVGITKARELIPYLRAGLEKLISAPGKFKVFNAPNGWGLYEHFVSWVKAYLAACEEYPDADVQVSR